MSRDEGMTWADVLPGSITVSRPLVAPDIRRGASLEGTWYTDGSGDVFVYGPSGVLVPVLQDQAGGVMTDQTGTVLQ